MYQFLVAIVCHAVPCRRSEDPVHSRVQRQVEAPEVHAEERRRQDDDDGRGVDLLCVLGHVTRFISLRTSVRKRRDRPHHPVITARRSPPAGLSDSCSIVAIGSLETLLISDLRVRLSTFGAQRTAFAGLPAEARSPDQAWQVRRDSNPQPPVLETDALPIELLTLFARLSVLPRLSGSVPELNRPARWRQRIQRDRSLPISPTWSPCAPCASGRSGRTC